MSGDLLSSVFRLVFFCQVENQYFLWWCRLRVSCRQLLLFTSVWNLKAKKMIRCWRQQSRNWRLKIDLCWINLKKKPGMTQGLLDALGIPFSGNSCLEEHFDFLLNFCSSVHQAFSRILSETFVQVLPKLVCFEFSVFLNSHRYWSVLV